MTHEEPTERPLPMNIEAEQGVLASLLIDPECVLQVMAFLKPADFYRQMYRQVYAAICDLWRAHTPADSITLADELKRRGQREALDAVHSLPYAVPTSANVEYYARIVERCAVNRRMIAAAGKIAAIGYANDEPDAGGTEAFGVLRAAITRHGAAQDSTPFDAIVDAFLDEKLSAMERGTISGVLFQLAGMRNILTGLKPGELVYACGRPGAGKSVLAATLAWQEAEQCVINQRGTVEYITLEMKAAQVAGRILAGFAEVNTRILRADFQRPDGTIDTAAWEAVRKSAILAKQRIRDRLRMWDVPIQLSHLRRQLERAVSERGCRLAIIDYIALMTPEDSARRQDEYQRITSLSRDLKQLALELNIPIICLVQMSRASENRANPRPKRSDLRDSGGLEQDGDIILGIYRGAEYMRKTASLDEKFAQFVELSVLKVREAEPYVVIPLRFEGAYTRMTDWPDSWDYRTYLTLTPTDDEIRQANGGD